MLMPSKTRLLRLALMLAVLGALGVLTLAYFYKTYDAVRDGAEEADMTFWKQEVLALTPTQRAALLNYVDRTGEVPHVLPWWEYDADRCSATVTKYVVLFSGIELVHAPAWRIREHSVCPTCVKNSRKMITRWEVPQNVYGDDGSLDVSDRDRIVSEVMSLDFDPNRIYMIGLLWSQTRWWETILEDGEDINSHVALVVRGKVLHFIHTDAWSDPLKVETLEELFASGDLGPVWVTEVTQKSRTRPGARNQLVHDPYVLPRTECELPFEQTRLPWLALSTLTELDGLPFSTEEVNSQFDTFLEKSVLHRLAQWGPFDMYPRFNKEDSACDDD